jgi:hypothetical protein
VERRNGLSPFLFDLPKLALVHNRATLAHTRIGGRCYRPEDQRTSVRQAKLPQTPFFVRIAKFGSWVGEIVSEVGDHAPGTWNQCNSIHCAESRFTWVKR